MLGSFPWLFGGLKGGAVLLSSFLASKNHVFCAAIKNIFKKFLADSCFESYTVP